MARDLKEKSLREEVLLWVQLFPCRIYQVHLRHRFPNLVLENLQSCVLPLCVFCSQHNSLVNEDLLESWSECENTMQDRGFSRQGQNWEPLMYGWFFPPSVSSWMGFCKWRTCYICNLAPDPCPTSCLKVCTSDTLSLIERKLQPRPNPV